MSKTNTQYTSELHAAVKLFIDQPLNNPLTRSQIMDIARVALPMLENQQRVDGIWIAWPGGLRPCGNNSIIDIKMRDGTEIKNTRAGFWVWDNSQAEDDIIAYRVVKS